MEKEAPCPASRQRFALRFTFLFATNYPLAITITTGLLLLVYQAIFTSLCVAFGILGFHKGEGFPDAGPQDDVSPQSSVASNEAIEIEN